MRLYSNRASPNVRRVRLTAAVLGIALDEEELDFAKGEHKRPEYLQLNPQGAVPTLVDGDFVLTESRAIMQYLASRRPDVGLLPLDDRSRAEVVRWQFWDASHFSPQLGAFVFEKIVKPRLGMGEPDLRKLEEALAAFRRFAAILDLKLAGRRYLVGGALTLADLTLATSLMYADETEVPVAEFPNIQMWLSGITEMDAWKRTSP